MAEDDKIHEADIGEDADWIKTIYADVTVTRENAKGFPAAIKGVAEREAAGEERPPTLSQALAELRASRRG